MALTSEQRRHGFRLGDRLVQPMRGCIRGPAGEVRLEPKVMQVLVCLAEQAGEVVPRETIYERVWGNTLVTDQALTNCISELRHQLGDDRSTPRFIETVPRRGYRLVAPVCPASPESGSGVAAGIDVGGIRWRRPALLGVGLLVAALAVVSWWPARSDHEAGPTTVLVLPFDNPGGDDDLAYLRLAVPDEITTVLTRAKGLAVRPFESGAWDGPTGAARARDAAYVVTGHYYREGDDRLTVAIEAQDVKHARLVWHARVSVPADDVLALVERTAGRIRDGFLPAVGVRDESVPPMPADPEAYRLYLRSLAVARDPAHNPAAIEMLEHVVERDPVYAPAWASLAQRYHDEHAYGGAADAMLERASEAAERALAIDPELIDAVHHLINLETEAGRLQPAHRRASALVEGRPDSAKAHFALAYVLRYGGMLEASRRHCELALDLDPHDAQLRSCAFSYMAAGDLGRAPRFIELDSGSYWANLVSVHYWLRRGDDRKARQYAQRLAPDSVERSFHLACLDSRPGRTPDGVTGPFIEQWQSRRDPEPSYWIGSEMAYCGRPEDALRLLEGAINGGYCSYPALDEDPAWTGLRKDAAFRRLREDAIACHERFRDAVRDPSRRDAANPTAADGDRFGHARPLARNPQHEPEATPHEARQELRT